MNTLITLHQQPLSIRNPSSWHQRIQPLHPETLKTLVSLSTRSWKLQAQAKGFGGTPRNTGQENKNAPKLDKGKNEDDDDDKIPEIVFERMIRRILAYVGLPLATGVVFLQLFGWLKEKHIYEVPLWLTFVTTFVTFGSSVLGVAYGSLSTSWDPDKQGSLLGLEEAKQNWTEMWKEEDNNKT